MCKTTEGIKTKSIEYGARKIKAWSFCQEHKEGAKLERDNFLYKLIGKTARQVKKWDEEGSVIQKDYDDYQQSITPI